MAISVGFGLTSASGVAALLAAVGVVVLVVSGRLDRLTAARAEPAQAGSVAPAGMVR